MFWAIILPILRSTVLCFTPHPACQQAALLVLYTTRCKHSLVVLRIGEIIAQNMLS